MSIIQNCHVRNVFTKKHFKIYIFQQKKGPPRVPRNSIEGPRDKEIHSFGTSKMRCSGHKTFSKVSRLTWHSVQNFYKTKNAFFRKNLFFRSSKINRNCIRRTRGPFGDPLLKLFIACGNFWMIIFCFYDWIMIISNEKNRFSRKYLSIRWLNIQFSCFSLKYPNFVGKTVLGKRVLKKVPGDPFGDLFGGAEVAE